MKNLDKLFSAIVGFSAYQIYQVMIDRGNAYLYSAVNLLEIRPFLYRVLVPLICQALDHLPGIGWITSVMIVMVSFSIVLFYAIRSLYETFGDDGRGPMVAFIACESFFLLILLETKIYDIPTAAFFTLSLLALAQRKYWIFYILYPLATLNRETTFLLSIFYVIYYFRGPISRRHWFYGSVYQGLVYILIRLFTMAAFADHPGVPFILSWKYVLASYSQDPKTILLILIVLILLFLVFLGWNHKPPVLRVAFITIFPLQILLHLLMGMPFETRVFAEIFPILSLLVASAPLPHRLPLTYLKKRTITPAQSNP